MRLELNIDWKRTLLIAADVVLAVYLLLAFTSWHTQEAHAGKKCARVFIDIADENENGFLKSADIKKLLESERIFPLGQTLGNISMRDIEDRLRLMPFVKTAQCYATQQGYVYVTVTQRTPVLRVKAASGDDYYIDDNGGVMPNSQYTSDMIIATGDFNRQYATQCLFVLAQTLMGNDLWRNLVEQINVQEDGTVELVPRVGDHIVNIGSLPDSPVQRKREQMIREHTERQMNRLEQFYRYGLCHAGWKKYDYISLEFCNQIVCRKRKEEPPAELQAKPDNDAAPETKQKDEKSGENKEQGGKKQENKNQGSRE